MNIEAHIELLRTGRTEDRIEAAKALAQARDPRAVEPLVRLAEGGTEWEATNAVEALAAIGTPEVIPVLIAALAAEARKAAIDALQEGPAKRHELSHRAVATEQRTRDLRDLRTAAARGLGALKAADAIPTLAEALFDTHESTPRRSCAAALRAIGTPAAEAALERLQEARRTRRRGD